MDKEDKKPRVSTVVDNTPVESSFTVVVVGAARGGTSAVGGLLRIMGIFMGKELNVLTHEDLEFLQAREPLSALVDTNHAEHDHVANAVKQLVDTRNADHGIWGWKDPLSFHYVPHIYDSLINPRLIFIYRDYYSISEREHIESGRSFRDSFNRAHDDFNKINDIVHEYDCPKLLTGYEKVIRYPEVFVRDLSQFLGVELDAERFKQAVDFLKFEKGYVTLEGDSFNDIKRKADEILEAHPELRDSSS